MFSTARTKTTFTEFPEDSHVHINMLIQSHPHHTEHVIYAGAPRLLQQVVISLILTYDLHIQLWFGRRPDSEPSIKVKEEVVRWDLTYQSKHRGPQKECWLGAKREVTKGVVCVCSVRIHICACRLSYIFVCNCVNGYFLSIFKTNT